VSAEVFLEDVLEMLLEKHVTNKSRLVSWSTEYRDRSARCTFSILTDDGDFFDFVVGGVKE
jgi:hypothetical protein